MQRGNGPDVAGGVGADVPANPALVQGLVKAGCGSEAGWSAARASRAGSALESYRISSGIREGSRERREGCIEEARAKMEKARSKGTLQARGSEGRVEEA